MPKASSSKVTLDSLLAQERGKLPYSRPCTQADPTRDIDDYLLKVEREDWPEAIVKFFTAACKSQGFFHCLKRECRRHPRFLPDKSHDFFRHLASKSLHGKEYPYGPIYYCRGRTKGDAEPCPFTNTQIGNATTHIKSIHLGIKSICEFCQKECRSDSGKLRHQERFHAELLAKKREEKEKGTASPSTSTYTTPSPTTPTPPPTTPRRNKRKVDDVELSEPESSRAVPKRRRAGLSVAQKAVRQSKPRAPSPPTTNTLNHIATPTNTTPLPTPTPFSGLQWNTDPFLYPFASESTTSLTAPTHDPTWNWVEFNMGGLAPLTQTNPAPALFPGIPHANTYGAEANYVNIQQSTDLLNTLAPYAEIGSNDFLPPPDPFTPYFFDPICDWDYSTTLTLQQPLTCVPGEYFY